MLNFRSYNVSQTTIFRLILLWLTILSIIETSLSTTTVKNLPGYSGELPFTLETGYLSVGETEDVQLFYYFVESQRSPADDPLLLWLTGGPGCSTLLAFFYESGPLAFTYSGYNGSIPNIHDNPYTWTKALNVIYLDAPVGTGFSYSDTSEGYVTGDILSSQLTYEFLRKWLINHPEYTTNQFYIGGDSYSGITVAMIVREILEGNDNGSYPAINLKGYVLGNPKTDSFFDDNSRIAFAHRMTLIPHELYKAAETTCNGDYVNVNTSNYACEAALETIEELVRQINLQQVVEPTCSFLSPNPNEGDVNSDRRSLRETSIELLQSQSKDDVFWCRNYAHVLAKNWANDKSVHEALNITEGTISRWKMCNSSLSYTEDITSVISYHKNFTQRDIRALIYSGDHDMSIPHIGTRNWIRSLNITLGDSWRPWYVDAQVAGYTEEYTNDDYVLTFATVKGGGHIAAEYKQKECSAMIDRWFAYYPL